MKKQGIYIWFLLTVFVLGACKRTEDPIFDKNSAERLSEAVEHAYDILQGNSNGWMLKYYPASTMEFGGYTLFIDFVSDKDATLTSDINKNAITSSYAVIAEGGPVLTFNGYNKVIHYFSEPGADSGVGAADSGLRGDFEFIIIEATPEKVTLKGKKSGNLMELIPLGGDAAQVIEDYQQEADFFAQFGAFKIERPNGEIEDLSRNMRAFSLSSDANQPRMSFRVVPNGLELPKEYELDGVKFTNLAYHEPTGEYDGGYYADETGQVKIFSVPTPLNTWMKSNLWSMSYSNVGPTGKVYWDNARTALAANNIVLNNIYIGDAGVEVIYYVLQDGTVEGAVGHDIIPVEGTTNEVQIVFTGSLYNVVGFSASYWTGGLNQFTTPLNGRTFVITSDVLVDPTEILLTDKALPSNTYRLFLDDIDDPLNN